MYTSVSVSVCECRC